MKEKKRVCIEIILLSMKGDGKDGDCLTFLRLLRWSGFAQTAKRCSEDVPMES